jgi:hypothetical protein
MSLRFRDGEGNEVVVSGLTPGGDLELGVTGQRKGTVTTGAIAAGDTANVTITFDEELPRDDYEVLLSAGVGFSIGTPYDKTTGSFKVPVKNNGASTAATNLTYDAFVLLDADETNQLRRRVDEVESDLDNKQDKLTFDNKPTANSSNPVTSGGVKGAIDDAIKEASVNTCNPNLLDNAWFSVNQRGASSYTTNGRYCFDRWRHNLEDGGEIKTISGSYTGVIVKSNGEWGNINQRIMPEYINSLIGKKFVLSAIVKSDIATTIRLRFGYRNGSGVISEGSIIYEVNVPANTKMLIQSPATVLPAISQSATGYTYMFYPQRSTSATRANVTVYATKLEVSEAGSTLENETAPPRPVELAKCQRYFYRYSVSAGGHATYIPAQLYSNTLALCMLPIPTSMRAEPTLTVSDDVTSSSSNFRFAYGGTTGSSIVQLTQITVYSITPGAIIIQLNMASDSGIDGSKDNGFLRFNNKTAYLDFSAEP